MMPRYRDSNRPVFGRVLTREPLKHFAGLRNRPFDGNVRYYGSETRTASDPQQRRFQFRSGGGGGNINSLSHRGKFNQLKEVVLTERAKELAAQRRLEEMAARAAVLKDIANGQSLMNHRPQTQFSYSPLMDENRSPDNDQMQMDEAPIHGKFLAGQTSPAIGQRSIFSGSPASNSGRSGGVMFLPSKIANNRKLKSDDLLSETKIPLKPSVFRERNKSLFRQPTTQADYYQRDIRTSDHLNSPENYLADNDMSFNENLENLLNENSNEMNNDNISDDNGQEKLLNLDELQKLYEQTKKQLNDDYLKYIFYNNNN